MKIKTSIFLIVVVLIAAGAGLFIASTKTSEPPILPQQPDEKSDAEQRDPLMEPILEEEKLILPIPEYFSRITKKSFGTYVTPLRSPVQPEKFTGYHNAVDVEFDDDASPVPVYAIGDGEIIQAQWVSGYGGLIVLRTIINGEQLYVLYGHLNTESMTPQTVVTKGDQLAVLGDAYSRDTDGERKHLHFGIRKGTLDIRGYVQSQVELTGWVDPIPFIKQLNGL